MHLNWASGTVMKIKHYSVQFITNHCSNILSVKLFENIPFWIFSSQRGMFRFKKHISFQWKQSISIQRKNYFQGQLHSYQENH